MELPEEICFKITRIQSKKHSGLPSPAQGPFGNQRNPFLIFFKVWFSPQEGGWGFPQPTAPWCWWGLAKAGLFLAAGWPGRSRQGAQAAFLTFPSPGTRRAWKCAATAWQQLGPSEGATVGRGEGPGGLGGVVSGDSRIVEGM